MVVVTKTKFRNIDQTYTNPSIKIFYPYESVIHRFFLKKKKKQWHVHNTSDCKMQINWIKMGESSDREQPLNIYLKILSKC